MARNGHAPKARFASLALKLTEECLNGTVQESSDRLIEVQQDNLTLIVRIPVPTSAGPKLLASISPRSILFLSLPDEPDEEDTSLSFGEHLRVITLPVEIDPEQVAAFIDDKELTLALSVSAAMPALA